MEFVAYIVISLLTFFGITALPSRKIVMNRPSLVNSVPIIGAIIIWNTIDIIYLSLLNSPIPIVLFLICWLIKLIEDNVIRKASWQTHVNMAEAWVLFIWAILSIFGDYRSWF